MIPTLSQIVVSEVGESGGLGSTVRCVFVNEARGCRGGLGVVRGSGGDGLGAITHHSSLGALWVAVGDQSRVGDCPLEVCLRQIFRGSVYPFLSCSGPFVSRLFVLSLLQPLGSHTIC